ncbi:hypothetical protein DL93DRAFT_1420236 [Clavulina sp. PMI_390]|nr:hypothetical protein DL93DRAFT_1420236 [Clavulina sp. PMI_390]
MIDITSPSSQPSSADISSATNRIPVELWSDILHLVVQAYPLLERNTALQLITSICQHWRHIALSLPLLWSAIVFDGSRAHSSDDPGSFSALTKRRFQTFLERSQNLPLDIVYQLHHTDNTAFYVTTFRELIVPQFSRCQSLHIGLATMAHLQHLLPLPKGLDSLRSLSLDIRILDRPFRSPPIISIFAPDNNALLQHLRIVSIYMPVSLDNLAPQEIQNFTYCPPEASPATEDLMEWLDNAPLLKEFSLTTSGTPSRPPTDLPDLHFLRITSINPSKIIWATHLVRLDWTVPQSGIPRSMDLSEAGRHLPNLHHLGISSLNPGGFSRMLPFLQEVSTVVHLRLYHWMWDDVVSLVRALAVQGE